MDVFKNGTLTAITLKMQQEGTQFLHKAGRFLLDLRLVLLKIFLTVAGTVFVPSLLAYYVLCFFVLAYFNLILLLPMMLLKALRIKLGYMQGSRNANVTRISMYKLSPSGELTEENVEINPNVANTSAGNSLLAERVEQVDDRAEIEDEDDE